MHARAAIAAPAVGMDAADSVDRGLVALSAGAFGPAPPCVVAAGTDLQHRAHHPHHEERPVVRDDAEPHLGGPEKMAMAFSKMSRSICARSSSFRRRRISAGSPDGVGMASPARAGMGTRPAGVLGRPRQARRIEGCMQSSIATCVSGRPLQASSDTASRLNSAVNVRRAVVVMAPRSLSSLSEVSTQPPEGQARFEVDDTLRRLPMRTLNGLVWGDDRMPRFPSQWLRNAMDMVGPVP